LNSNAQRFRREKSKRYFAHVATSLMSPVRSCRRPRRNGHLHGDDRSAPYHAQIGRPSNAVRSEARGDLAVAHPTAKPVALVADAIRDSTRRGDVVLDTFSGSGTTVMAAERVGRHARALEIEPRFVDVAIRRWQAFTRRDAFHAESRLSFDKIAAEGAPSGTASPRPE